MYRKINEYIKTKINSFLIPSNIIIPNETYLENLMKTELYN